MPAPAAKTPRRKLKPMTLRHFAAWLAKQPKTGRYDYEDNRNCLCAQYLRDIGKKIDGVGPEYYRLTINPRREIPLPRGFEDTAEKTPWTFGAAAKRAKALLKAAP